LKARVFLLNSQEKLYEKIKTSLSCMYKGISVEPPIIYEKADKAGKEQIGRSYLNLLKASMVKVRDHDITLYVEDELGQWGYWGGSGDKGVQYFRLKLQHRSKTDIFPSVAVMDRMVMVPEGIHHAFDVPKEFQYLFKPFDAWQGVILVDFRDDGAIRDAVERVGAQIRNEIAALVRRYIVARSTRTPELKDLSKLLDVDEDFLNGLGDEVLKPSSHLIPEIKGGPARLNTESRVTLEIRNESDDAPGIVRVQIRAPYNVMNGTLTRSVDFSSREIKHREIPFTVMPSTTPYCPLAVRLGEESFPIPLVLPVVEK
jgi:hypothetical protein